MVNLSTIFEKDWPMCFDIEFWIKCTHTAALTGGEAPFEKQIYVLYVDKITTTCWLYDNNMMTNWELHAEKKWELHVYKRSMTCLQMLFTCFKMSTACRVDKMLLTCCKMLTACWKMLTACCKMLTIC